MHVEPIEVDSVEAKWQRGGKRGGSREKRGQKGKEAEERVGREGSRRAMYHWPRVRVRVACPPRGVRVDRHCSDGWSMSAGWEQRGLPSARHGTRHGEGAAARWSI